MKNKNKKHCFINTAKEDAQLGILFILSSKTIVGRNMLFCTGNSIAFNKPRIPALLI